MGHFLVFPKYGNPVYFLSKPQRMERRPRPHCLEWPGKKDMVPGTLWWLKASYPKVDDSAFKLAYRRWGQVSLKSCWRTTYKTTLELDSADSIRGSMGESSSPVPTVTQGFAVPEIPHDHKARKISACVSQVSPEPAESKMAEGVRCSDTSYPLVT